MKNINEILEQVDRLKERIEHSKRKKIVMFPRVETEILKDHIVELRTLLWVLGNEEETIDIDIYNLFNKESE